MCNLYSITTNQEAISRLFRKVNRYVGNLAPMPGVFPDYPAPVIRNAGEDSEMVLMRWGMPPSPRLGGPPVTNIRNTSSPHWRGWLKPENRCLVPFKLSTRLPALRLARNGGLRLRLDPPYELIFCDQLTQVGILSEIFGTFLAIRSATNRDKAGPMIRTSIKRATCCAITNPTSTLVDAAIMATESAPPGLVAR